MSSASTDTSSTTSDSFILIDEDEDDGNDSAIPSEERVREVLDYSHWYWSQLAIDSSPLRMDRDTIKLEEILLRTPKLPDTLASGPRNGGSVEGYATWRLTSECKGDVKSERYGQKHEWPLSTSSHCPTPVLISEQTSFQYGDKRSGVALLFLGWAYILSAKLVEKQGIPMLYLHPRQQVGASLEKAPRILHLGRVSAAELRWWKCLTAPGQSWRSRKSNPPWATANVGGVDFLIKAVVESGAVGLDACPPPSSSEALKYLARFASRHGLVDQSALALAMVLSLPLHNQLRSRVFLPASSSFGEPLVAANTIQDTDSMMHDFQNISYYMTLSFDPMFFSSALLGTFWQPGVECNVVSAWNEPILQAVVPLIKDGETERLAHLLALRSGHLAPLWYGTLACGPTKFLRSIPNFLKTLHSPFLTRPMPEVAAWTGSPQSWMDEEETKSGPYGHNDYVSRSDVWRLRHQFCDGSPSYACFSNPPFCPWPPFGDMLVDETELHVRSHMDCSRHRWEYHSWTWCGETEIVDTGFSSKSKATRPDHGCQFKRRQGPEPSQDSKPPDISTDNVASERATGHIFRWITLEMEPSGKEIYEHRWVEAVPSLRAFYEFCVKKEEESEEYTNSSDDGGSMEPQVNQERVEEWRRSLVQQYSSLDVS